MMARVAQALGAGLSLLLGATTLTGCTGAGTGDPVRVRVPRGAAFATVVDSLEAHGIVRFTPGFRIYARVTGAADEVKPGTYAFRRNTGWRTVLSDLEGGRFLKEKLVIPEGWEIARIAPRIARVTGVSEDSVVAVLADSATVQRFGVPGPTLEGYLYPATYTFPLDAPLDTVISDMIAAYDRVWTDQRAAADSAGMTEREVVTLASIVEKEAKKPEEMPLIASVYRNRLRIGIPLQADPTVQYALGGHRERLLYSAIDSAAGNPYNTYRYIGLPPGPIGSPSERAIDAVLHPADTDYLYFVARPDGTHVFTRSLREHNQAKAAIRRERRRLDSARADTADARRRP